MLRALYSAATGMESQQLNLDVISNNLANVNTTGFKRKQNRIPGFALSEHHASPAPSRATATNCRPECKSATARAPSPPSKIFTEGELTQTGERLDIAIQGDGFFQVQMPDGTLAYTRDGSLKTSSEGQITTSEGLTGAKRFSTHSRRHHRRHHLARRPGHHQRRQRHANFSGAAGSFRQPGRIAEHRTQFIHRNDRLRHAGNGHSDAEWFRQPAARLRGNVQRQEWSRKWST